MLLVANSRRPGVVGASPRSITSPRQLRTPLERGRKAWKTSSRSSFQPRVRLRILSSTLEALLVQALPGLRRESFHGQKAVLGPASTGLQAFWPTPCRFHDPALQPASRLMYLSFYQHRFSAVGCMRQVIVMPLRGDYDCAKRSLR